MIQSVSLKKDGTFQQKKRFLFNWIISNACGMSIGWCLGEYLGQAIFPEYGMTAARIATAITFEFSLWLARLMPTEYFSRQRPIKLLDGLIWFGTEITGWVIFSFINSDLNILAADVILISGMGVTFWIIIAIFNLLRAENKRNPDWFAKNLWYALFGFLLGNSLVMGILTTAISINYSIARMFGSYVGWGVAGLFLGGTFGAITGFILLGLINWDRYEGDFN